MDSCCGGFFGGKGLSPGAAGLSHWSGGLSPSAGGLSLWSWGSKSVALGV